MTGRSICLHGHFYQPPRENPFTGEIPREAGAEPWANYNERINAECYAPNARLGNFRHISFDIGPTLTTWLARHDPVTLWRIAQADRGARREHGAGPAMAQGYHHTILPLDAPRDRRTQVRWGIRDFQYRFGRPPLGLWLPETAADLATLDLLATEGIAYTILAPWQAAHERIDTSRPYTVALPSGREIAVFFYDAVLSGLISFHPETTVSAPRFIEEHLRPRYGPGREPRLLLLASDGELYGHHQPFRDLFLQDLLRRLPAAGLDTVTPAGYLRLAPEREHVAIREGTSWSCHHGVERWRAHCGCIDGEGAWKTELRDFLDAARATIDGLTEEAAGGLVHDVWAARDDYIEVVLGTLRPDDWLERHAARSLVDGPARRVLDLMEAQRYRLAMYASCAFFWEDVARIEPRNAIAGALRALRLVERATGARLEADARQTLTRITSRRTRQSAAEILADLAAGEGTGGRRGSS